MIENEIKRFEKSQLERQKAKYSKFNLALMIATVLSMFIGWQFAVVLLLLTTLSLVSGVAVDTRIKILESEIQSELMDKYLKE